MLVAVLVAALVVYMGASAGFTVTDVLMLLTTRITKLAFSARNASSDGCMRRGHFVTSSSTHASMRPIRKSLSGQRAIACAPSSGFGTRCTSSMRQIGQT